MWGATVGGAVAIGPLVGGALTSAFGWQWIFYVNVPIGVVTLLVSRRMVNMADPGAEQLDWSGLLTFSGGLFLLILGLTRGNDDGWSSPKIVLTLGAAAVLLVTFVIVELRQTRPMFDLSLFRKPAFTGVSIATFGVGAGMFALLPYLTLYLQNDLGLSPLQGGERLLPLTTLSFVVPLASRPVTERVPAGLALTVGLAISAVGIWMFTGLTVASTWTALLPGLLVGGVGVGLANPAIAKIALGVVAPQRAGMASGVNNTFRIGGVATGVAALGAVFQHRIQSTLHPVAGPEQAHALARAVAARRSPGGGEDLGAAGGAQRLAPRLRQRDERRHRGGGGHRPRGGGFCRARAAQGLLLTPARRLPARRPGPRPRPRARSGRLGGRHVQSHTFCCGRSRRAFSRDAVGGVPRPGRRRGRRAARARARPRRGPRRGGLLRHLWI